MLAPNWEDHDIEKNSIVNYFADRQHTELILRKIEKKLKHAASTATNLKTARRFFGTKTCSNNMVSGHLTKTLNTGMFLTQTGAKATNFLDFCRLEILNFRCKYHFFREININYLSKKTSYIFPILFTNYLFTV